jgi:DNA-binding NarL/FixJ family response regulator
VNLVPQLDRRIPISKGGEHLALLICNPLLWPGLRKIVKSARPVLKPVAAETLANASDFLRKKCRTALVCLDMNVPDCAGLTGLSLLRSEFPQIPVVVVSPYADSFSIGNAMALGAAGYIPESTPYAEIERGLQKILAGHRWFPSLSPQDLVHDRDRLMASLSPAHRRILMGFLRGLRNKEIAFEMGLSEKTIKHYITVMFRRLGVSSRAQALILARDIFAGPNVVKDQLAKLCSMAGPKQQLVL